MNLWPTRKEKIRRSCGPGDKIQRDYIVTYKADSRARKEAVRFFGSYSSREPLSGLFQAMTIPVQLDLITQEEGQKYLDAHPIQKQWVLLSLLRECCIKDEDLKRLQEIPELKIFRIVNDSITDRGVKFIPVLKELEHLILYSNAITDACLDDLMSVRSLQTLDMQGSPGISQAAFSALVKQLPSLKDSFPPRNLASNAESLGGPAVS